MKAFYSFFFFFFLVKALFLEDPLIPFPIYFLFSILSLALSRGRSMDRILFIQVFPLQERKRVREGGREGPREGGGERERNFCICLDFSEFSRLRQGFGQVKPLCRARASQQLSLFQTWQGHFIHVHLIAQLAALGGFLE